MFFTIYDTNISCEYLSVVLISSTDLTVNKQIELLYLAVGVVHFVTVSHCVLYSLWHTYLLARIQPFQLHTVC
jgi:hypothetical protein